MGILQNHMAPLLGFFVLSIPPSVIALLLRYHNRGRLNASKQSWAWCVLTVFSTSLATSAVIMYEPKVADKTGSLVYAAFALPFLLCARRLSRKTPEDLETPRTGLAVATAGISLMLFALERRMSLDRDDWVLSSEYALWELDELDRQASYLARRLARLVQGDQAGTIMLSTYRKEFETAIRKVRQTNVGIHTRQLSVVTAQEAYARLLRCAWDWGFRSRSIVE